MTHVSEMLATYPKDLGRIDRTRVQECTDATLGRAVRMRGLVQTAGAGS